MEKEKNAKKTGYNALKSHLLKFLDYTVPIFKPTTSVRWVKYGSQKCGGGGGGGIEIYN